MGAVVLLDKSPGLTSFSSLRVLKKALGKKAGHAGTLDKFASGLLIAFSGNFTRLNDLFMGLDKNYQAVIQFGKETDTLDPEGEVIAQAPVPSLSDIQNVLPTFKGRILQRPPLYSAIHIDGKRSYKLARENKVFVTPEKEVELDDYRIIKWENSKLTIDLQVSKGFYVRSFARDLALAASSRAYVQELRRTRIGPYCVDDAVDCLDEEKIKLKALEFDPLSFLLKINGVFEHKIDGKQYSELKHGKMPELEIKDGEFSLLSFQGKLCAVVSSEKKFVCWGD